MDHSSSSDAESLVMSMDSDSRRLFDGDHRAEAERYLRAVDEIRRKNSAGSSPEHSDLRRSASASLQLAMARLEDELSYILSSRANDVENDLLTLDFSSLSMSTSNESDANDAAKEEEDDENGSGSGIGRYDSLAKTRSRSGITSRIWEIDLMPSDAVLDIRSIAEQMIGSGYEAECFRAYIRCRRASMDFSLEKLGVERLGIGDVQAMSWAAAESKIRRWIRAASASFRILFASERRLLELVFDCIAGDRDVAAESNTFAEIVKGAALQLLGFPDAISVGHRGVEKLFKVIDLHDVLLNLLPDIELVFGGPNSPSDSAIRKYATDIVERLADSIRGILIDFEIAVYKERSTAPVPNGNLHPMTRYVMNYINLITGYKQSLSSIVVSGPSASALPVTEGNPPPEISFHDLDVQSPLAMHLIWIIAILCSNLERGASLYREIGLSHVFLLNNIHYIVHKVKDSPELRELIGNDYLRVLMAKYLQEASSYQRAVWVNILNCLRDEGIQTRGSFSSSGISSRILKERFRSFNTAFDEAHRTQQAWIVPDVQLKEELRIAISVRLLPAYRGFLSRYRQYIENGRHPEQYIKYSSAEELDEQLGDFFEGIAQQSSSHFSRRRSL